MVQEYINGAILCFSLIVAIGAQNLFIIQQGLSKNHVFWVCLVSFLGDCLVFSVGIFGVGVVAGTSSAVTSVLCVAGVLFLCYYGIMCLRSAFNGANFAKISNAKPEKLSKTLAKTVAVSLLNPHVWIDAIVLIGGFSASLNGSGKLAFFAGSVSVSLVWFFALGFGAVALSKFFKNARAWQVLDILIAAMMFYIAFVLLNSI